MKVVLLTGAVVEIESMGEDCFLDTDGVFHYADEVCCDRRLKAFLLGRIDIIRIMEGTIRCKLPVKDWSIANVAYEPSYDGWAIVIRHWTFEHVNVGESLPVIEMEVGDVETTVC